MNLNCAPLVDVLVKTQEHWLNFKKLLVLSAFKINSDVQYYAFKSIFLSSHLIKVLYSWTLNYSSKNYKSESAITEQRTNT